MYDFKNVVWDDDLYNEIRDKLSIKPTGRAPDRDVVVLYNTRQKIYPDGTVVLKRYKFTPSYRKDGYELVDDKKELSKTAIKDDDLELILPDKKEETPLDEKKITERMQETRNKIYDISASNDWTHFITLTYDSTKCDRYSFADTSKKVRQFLNNFSKYNKSTCPNFRYLIVHECHKDGAYHYHGLIYLEDDSSMSDSGKKTKKKDQPILNWDKWSNGWSTATLIDNPDACAHYITKYITKSIGDDYQKGQRRFYYSQNCRKPSVSRICVPWVELVNYDCMYDSPVSVGFETDINDLMSERYGIDVNQTLHNIQSE